MSHNPVYAFLHEMPLENLSEKNQVVSLPSSATVEQAVKLLASSRVSSAPVIDDQSKRCLGLVDMLDIVWTVLKVAPDLKALKENDLKSLEISGRAMAFEQVTNAIGASGRDPYVPVYEKNPISSVIPLFANGIHRTPIFDEAGNIVGTTSQSDIIRLLSENVHMGKLKEMGEMTAEQLQMGLVTPITVPKNAPVIEVLKTIQDKAVTAVGIVEEDGKLAGNFSATDLEGMYVDKWPNFLLPVGDFLQQHSPNSLNSICCTRKTTLIDICKEFAQTKVHRLWVVDDDYKPIGVVSTTDIMKIIQDYSH
jgi:CBS domain-containing protein